MPKWVLHILAPLLCGVLLLLGVVALNALLRGHFSSTPRATIAFADIDCAPPGTLSREDFLAEVQYLANWPDEINLLEDGVAARLHLSFAVHPWVETVERVQIVPPRQLRVQLRFRTAVLAVTQADENDRPANRVVDGRGVLLPLAAADARLPVLAGKVAAPRGRTGQPWGDAEVQAAARVAALVHPHQEQLTLNRFEIKDGTLILSSPQARVLWGRPDPDDAADEATDSVKLQRLLDLHEQHGGLRDREYDLRAPERDMKR